MRYGDGIELSILSTGVRVVDLASIRVSCCGPHVSIPWRLYYGRHPLNPYARLAYNTWPSRAGIWGKRESCSYEDYLPYRSRMGI